MPKDTILIADDAELNREMIKFIFEEQYQIIGLRMESRQFIIFERISIVCA